MMCIGGIYLDLFEKHGGRRRPMAMWLSKWKMELKYNTTDLPDIITNEYARAVNQYRKIAELRTGAQAGARQGPGKSKLNIGRPKQHGVNRKARQEVESKTGMGGEHPGAPTQSQRRSEDKYATADRPQRGQPRTASQSQRSSDDRYTRKVKIRYRRDAAHPL